MNWNPNIPQRIVLLVAAGGLFFAGAFVAAHSFQMYDGIILPGKNLHTDQYIPVLLMLLSATIFLLFALHNLPKK